MNGLSKAERQKDGKTSAVIRLTFVSAFVLPEGVSLKDAVGVTGKSHPDTWKVSEACTISVI